MRAPTIIIAALAVLALALGLLLWREKMEYRTAFERLHSAERLRRDRAATAGLFPPPSSARQAGPIAAGSAPAEPPKPRRTATPDEAKRRQFHEVLAKIEWDPRAEKLAGVEDYGPILRTLHLSPSAMRRIKELLFERMQSADDAREIAEENHLAPVDASLATSRTQEQVDQEIQSVAGPAAGPVIKSMLDLSLTLGRVTATYAPEMAFAGHPLNGEQALALANTLNTVYDVPESATLDSNVSRIYHTQDVDPSTGLSTPDRKALQLAGQYLSPEQLSVLRADLATITSEYLARQMAPQL